MQFFVTQQRIAKKMRQEVPSWNSASARAMLSQGVVGNNLYLKLMPWVKYDDPRLSLAIIKVIVYSSHYSLLSFWLHSPNGFMIFQFYQKPSFCKLPSERCPQSIYKDTFV